VQFSSLGRYSHECCNCPTELTPELVKELFIRHMKRIAVHDGSVRYEHDFLLCCGLRSIKVALSGVRA
jgi:hypothetical protein